MPRCFSHPIAALCLTLTLATGTVRLLAATEASPWFFRAWQTEDGLPDNYVTGITQTGDGYLWVATTGGLVRFNGVKFVPIPQVNLPVMPSRGVAAILRDHRNRLWLGMERGPVLCLKPDGLRSFTAQDGVPDDERILSMAEARDGTVWISFTKTLLRIQKDVVTLFRVPPDWPSVGNSWMVTDAHGTLWFTRAGRLGVLRADGLQTVRDFSTSITSLCGDAQSGLWMTLNNHVVKLAEGQPPMKCGSLPNNALPAALVEDRAGVLWIGTTANGLFRLEGNRMEAVATSSQEITSLMEDREGNIWAGTGGGGMDLIRPRTVVLSGRESGLPFESVISVCEDTEGGHWAVAQTGELAREREGQWELMSATANWPGGSATCVAADRQNGVWVGTSDQGLKQFQNGQWREWRKADGLVSDSIHSLLVATNGDVWAATDNPSRLEWLHNGKVLMVLTPANPTHIGVIRAMAQDAKGIIWMGTSQGEIQRVSGSSLVTEPAIQEPRPLSVRSLLATADGSLWIGYAGDGLGWLKSSRYARLTTAAGLKDEFISQLLDDENGNLWLTGNRGLSRMSLAELEAVMTGQSGRLRIRAYGRSDGLPSLQPNRDHSPNACRGRDGRLWFSMHSGLLVVQPHNVLDNADPPPVHLEHVRVDDELVALYDARSPLEIQNGTSVLDLRAPTAALPIAPGHRKIEFGFAALSFVSPENVQFRYRLSGFDQKWIEAGTRRNVTYPRLPAGHYEFRVLACNSTGVWNPNGATLSLIVSPFFWETWWFKIGGGLATALTAGGSALIISRRRYRRKLQRLEARRALEQERTRIAKDIHDDLGSSLTRITLLSQSQRAGPNAVEESATSLEQIHATARQLTRSMEEVVWAVNPEHDTFDGLANYISNYAQSFLRPAGVRCRLEMPLQLPTQPLSAEVRHNLFLAFKESLNNVVKHAQATEVRISLTPGQAGFELLVEDNGRGFPAEPAPDSTPRAATSNGLVNMRSRLAEIGGHCELHSDSGVGTWVKFTVTLKPSHDRP